VKSTLRTGLDAGRLKAQVIELWRRGGMDTLVKIAPRGFSPSPGRNIGYCTTFKYVVGRTPLEMESILGFAARSKLANGAEIFLVRPLPAPHQFELRGYTQLPGGVPTNAPGYTAHADYPPGAGAPQWELSDHLQSNLSRLASLGPDERFAWKTATLMMP
jgi:hypothetical protein